MDIRGAFYPFLCVCGCSFMNWEEFQLDARKHLAGSIHVKNRHNTPKNTFSRPCIRTEKKTDSDLLLATLCNISYCYFLATNENELRFHKIIDHQNLENVVASGFPRSAAKVLWMQHYLPCYPIHIPGYQLRIRNLRNSLQPTGGPKFNIQGINMSGAVLTLKICWVEMDCEN